MLGAGGRGAVEQTGVLDRVDAVTVAFSKSLASVGGAVMTSRAAADGIRASALPYVFSAANDPASVGAALAALRLLRSEPERMARHPRERRAAAPRARRGRRPPPLPGRGAVIAVPTGDEEVTATAWRIAFDAGVYATPSPTRPSRAAEGVLRLSVMATHTAEQLHRAAEVVAVAVHRPGRRSTDRSPHRPPSPDAAFRSRG